MKTPSYRQLTNWCELHGVTLTREAGGVRAVAYDRNQQIITSIFSNANSAVKGKFNEAACAIHACDAIAESLLIVKPSVTFQLNSK